jgi:hypothetical protein
MEGRKHASFCADIGYICLGHNKGIYRRYNSNDTQYRITLFESSAIEFATQVREKI